MELAAFFQAHDRVAVAFSGGVDSTYLLYAAINSGAKVKAYYVKSAFQPQFELNDAKKTATELNADMSVIEADVLLLPEIAANPSDRCYYCKRLIFSTIAKYALADGYTTLIDGTNASDSEDDRPGMRALRELSVLSPLRECGLTKSDIRRLSKDAELSTWNKPAYSCLATSIPTGDAITQEKLEKIEHAEDHLMALGFSDFRIRMLGSSAKIQLPSGQFDKLPENRAAIIKELKKHFNDVLLDRKVRA